MRMLYLASQLAYFANIANLGSMITVILIFIAMVLFIKQFRLHEIDPSFTSVFMAQKPVVEEKALSKVNLPFSIKLGSHSCDGNESKLVVISSSEARCNFVVCSNFEPDSLKLIISQPWPAYQHLVLKDLKRHPNTYVHTEEEGHESKNFVIKSPVFDEPRTAYALVTFHLKAEVNDAENNPVSIITLIHVPDQYCTSPPTTLNQYLKFKDGRLLNLKPLYLSGSERLNEGARAGNTNCVICWNNPATKVLLPCRHACLCVYCFGRVDHCPVCRTFIISYFSV